MSTALPADAVLWLTFLLALPLFALLVVVSRLSCACARKWAKAPPSRTAWVERRWVFRPAAAVLALYALCILYGSWVEARWLQVTRTEIRVDRPVLGYDRFRIVHLSDLHLERAGPLERSLVEEVRRAQPQLIVVTGDSLNAREGAAALRDLLGAIAAPYGIVAVEGHWDAKFVTAEVFRRAGATLLADDTRVLERDGHRLRLVGQAIEPLRPLKDLLPPGDDGAFTVYLHHSPDAVDELRARGPDQRVHLFLCGHTHGGQVRLPFWGAIATLTRHHKEFEQGLYDVGGVPLYVNRGVGLQGGAVPRMRFLARPEMAVIELVYR